MRADLYGIFAMFSGHGDELNVQVLLVVYSMCDIMSDLSTYNIYIPFYNFATPRVSLSPCASIPPPHLHLGILSAVPPQGLVILH